MTSVWKGKSNNMETCQNFMSFWTVQALGLIPLGFFILFLLLTNFGFATRSCRSFLTFKISFGRISLNLGSLLAGVTVIAFIGQSITVYKIKTSALKISHSVEASDRNQMKEWRNERNWWMCLLSATIWCFNWRVSGLLESMKSKKSL